MRIVLDTNIYISAAIIGRVCEEMLKICRFGSLEVFISKDIIIEIETKLKDKFFWNDQQIRIFIENMLEFCHMVEVSEKILYLKDDHDDDKILECAVASGCTYIVSGDKHLTRLKSFRNIKILKPADFLILIK
ncbi:MAG: putative toxin-antitoxin system toxin component, PIN family [Actinobacteria bacterium]|nr:putative toxin-antitoxin system toxin component, PIN family [Actinomycetota bacterium]